MAIVCALWLGLMTLAFWFVAVENLSVLFDAVYETARFPVTAYPGALRFVLTYLLPMAWITTAPAAALTGRAGRWRRRAWRRFSWSSAVGWSAGLASYTSAGG